MAGIGPNSEKEILDKFGYKIKPSMALFKGNGILLSQNR